MRRSSTNVMMPRSASYLRSFSVISAPSSRFSRPVRPGSYGVPTTRTSTSTSACARLFSTSTGVAVSTSMLNRTRSSSGLRSSVRSSVGARSDRRQQPFVEVDVRGLAGLVDRHLPGDEDVIAAAGDADRRVGEAAQIERRVVGEVLRRELQVDVAHRPAAERHGARPFERAAVDVRR